MGMFGLLQDLAVGAFQAGMQSDAGRMYIGTNMTPGSADRMYAMQERRARERVMERQMRENQKSQAYNNANQSANNSSSISNLGLGAALVVGLGGLAISMLSDNGKKKKS